MIKSLVDWEKSLKDLEKQSSLEDELSGKDSVKMENKEDASNDFEKAKAHKSTVEAAVAMVRSKTGY